MSGPRRRLSRRRRLRALWAVNGWWLGRRYEKEKEQKPVA